MGAAGQPGLGRAGATSLLEAAPRPAGQDLHRGQQSQDRRAPRGPGRVGPAGASALPQGLQLASHLLQLCLDGRQALQLLVLGENIEGHAGTGPGGLRLHHRVCGQTRCVASGT